VRDRDRIRGQHLEKLGWRFHRIWSTAWFKHRDDEINRAVQAYEKVLESQVKN
jgi:very-short-patch-repair endonuclease